MNLRPATGWFYALPILMLSAWVLHGFVEALFASCVIAVASWPLYRAFRASMPRRISRTTTSLVFVALMAVFVLVPLIFAFVALVTEAHATLAAIAAADEKGMAAPSWLAHLPLAGPWLAARWANGLAHPGALSLWIEQAEPGALVSWAQSLGQFTLRHLFIVIFTLLLLFYLYQTGDALKQGLRRALRKRIGERAEHYLQVARHAVQAAVNSMLLVGLFDGCATWLAYALSGVPHAALWGAITGALGLVPLLGYVAVVSLALQLSMSGDTSTAMAAILLGSLVLLLGDKVVRPAMARNGTHLPYVWILMGCLGGFEVLGLVGLVVGPVMLTLSRELLAEIY